MSGLASPWRSFGRGAKAFLEATRSGDHGRVQSVVNTMFGELWKVAGEAPDWSKVAALREPYQFGTIADGVQVLTCGVDVQKDRLVYGVRGWGYKFESWQIRHGELWGETEHDAVWNDLAALLEERFGDFRIGLMAIDSGYRPGDRFKRPDHRVYEFARRFPNVVRATKGHDTLDRPLKANTIDVTVKGHTIKEGLQLWHLNTDHFKSWVHSRLAWPIGEPGAFHLSSDASDSYCQELVAEARLAKASGRVTWVRIRRENHALDVEALNVAASYMLQIHRLGPKRPASDTTETAPRRTIARSRYVYGN